MSEEKLTPMLEQYKSLKKENPEALLFFRMGDFYELFFEDAKIASSALQIALTQRNKDQPVPMCGVPWHSSQSYISQLLDQGFSVAICEQMEDPKFAKGLVQRAITRVITPGTVLEDANLQANSHNFLGAIILTPSQISSKTPLAAFVWADVSTGYWTGAEFFQENDLWEWLQKIAPRELLVPENSSLPKERLEGIKVVRLSDAYFAIQRATPRVLEAQAVKEIAALGLENKELLLRACGGLVAWLEQIQRLTTLQLQPFSPMHLNEYMLIDNMTERNLEIFQSLNGRKGKGTLRYSLDSTVTPMGGRLLENMLKHPLKDYQTLSNIQDVVMYFHNNDALRSNLRSTLSEIKDLERISTRISLGQAAPRELLVLENTLKSLAKVKQCFDNLNDLPLVLTKILQTWDPLDDCREKLLNAIVDTPPNNIGDGGIFKRGWNAGLDAKLDLVEHSEEAIKKLYEQQKADSGLMRLKLGHNRIFGHYYELGNSKKEEKIPSNFIRKQTLANGERFITQELSNLDESITKAEEDRKQIEYTLFINLRDSLARQRSRLLFMADIIANLDYWHCLAYTGRQKNWTRPILSDQHTNLDIVDGRHPVVEDFIGTSAFVPNSISLDQNRRICLLTGPNMAGKSTILRQTALICLLAQIGSLVPASKAEIGLVDKLFSRVGASDNLAFGLSTFMVEMMETARILRQASTKSLVILDEIGRGTSTFDGVAIAWAVVEFLASRKGGGLRTLFATHYHELTALEGNVAGVFTMNIGVREYGNEIIFLHKLLPGPASRSYGIDVAKLAGVPNNVVTRAKYLLNWMEKNNSAYSQIQLLPLPKTKKNTDKNLSEEAEHPLIEILQTLNPDKLSPEAALSYIKEWKEKWGNKNKLVDKNLDSVNNTNEDNFPNNNSLLD